MNLQTSKEINSDTFSLSLLQNLPLTEIEDLVVRAEIILNWKKILMKNSHLEAFLSSFSILTENLETCFFYLELYSDICQELDPKVLTSHCEANHYIQLTVKNLKKYLKRRKTRKFKLLVTHEEEIRARLEFLEILNSRSLCEIGENEEKLEKIVFLLYPDQILCNLFSRSFFYGLRFRCLCNNYFFSLERLINSQVLRQGAVNFYLFSYFKILFIRGNEKYSLEIKENKVSWVIRGDIKGLDELVIIFLNSDKLIMKKVLKILIILMTTFSSSLKDCYENVCLELIMKIKNHFDYQNSQHLERLVKIFHFSLKKILDPSKIDVELFFEGKWFTGNLYKKVRVNGILEVIENYFNNHDQTLFFSINSRIYGPEDQFKIVEIEENDIIKVFQSKEYFKIVLSKLFDYFEVFDDFFNKIIAQKTKISYKLFINFCSLKVTEKMLISINKFDFTVEEIEKKDDYSQFLITFHILFQSISKNDWLIRFISNGKYQDYLNYLIRYLDKEEYSTKLLWYIIEFCESSIKKISDPSVLLMIFCKLILLSYNNSQFIYIKHIEHHFKEYESILLNQFDYSILKTLNQNFVFENFEEIYRALTSPYFKSEFSVYLLNCLINIIKNSQSSILFTDKFLPTLDSELASDKLSIQYYVIIKLFKNINQLSPEKSKKIVQITISHLETYESKINESENENLHLMLELLEANSDLIDPPSNLQNFIESLVLPIDSVFSFPKCKSQESRLTAFSLSSKLLKSDPNAFRWLEPKLLKMIRCKHWRKMTEGSWNIQLNSIPSFDSFKGLKNPSCICYSNSLIQHLFHIKSFRNSVFSLNFKDDFNCLSVLQRVFLKLENCKSSNVSAKNLIRAFHGSDNFYEQMDADEFLLRLFEKCLNSGTGNAFEEILSNHFLGCQLNEYSSLECPHSFRREQNFWTLGLNVFKGVKNSLKSSLNTFIAGETLEGQNSILCEKCKKKVKFSIKPSLLQLPNFLFFSLKRFEYKLNLGKRTKLHDKFEIPTEIDMKKYANQEIWTEGPEDFLYKIKGVTIHVGTAQAGHYYSIVNTKDGDWYKFNDTRVRKISKEEMIQLSTGDLVGDDFQPSAYLLLYEKVLKKEINHINFSEKSKDCRRNMDLLKEGEMAGIKDFVFSEDFFSFMRKISVYEKFKLVYVEFFLNCVLRSSTNVGYFRRFYDVLEEITGPSEIFHILSILSSRDGALEFLVNNPNKPYKKLLLLLIKKKVSIIDKELIKGCTLNLLSVVKLYKNDNILSPSSVIHLIIILTEELDVNNQKYLINNFFIYILNFENFDQISFFGDKSEFAWNVNWKSIINSKIDFDHGYTQLFEYIKNHSNLLSNQHLRYIISLKNFDNFLRVNYTKLEKISYNKMLVCLLGNDTKISLGFIEYLLVKYSESLKTHILQNMHLFLKYHSQKLYLFVNIIENFIEILEKLTIEEMNQWYKYLIKFFYNLKFDDVKGYLTDSTIEFIENIKNILEIDTELHEYSEIYFNFIQGKDHLVFDSDDEIDPSLLVEGKLVSFKKSKRHEPAMFKISKNFGNEVIQLSNNEDNEELIDSTKFDNLRFL